MNVGNEYATSWRDIMARVRGPAVRALEHVFLDDWYFASGEDISHLERSTSAPGGDVACAVIASGPDREAYIHDAYFMMLTRAARRVWLVTPYFIPSDAIATALRTAASRGVDVQLLLPLSSDIGIVKHAARSYYRELLVAGARIFEYGGPMLHAKAFVVDHDLTAVGSANVDTRSFRLNFEIQCFLQDETNNQELAHWFETLRTDAHEVTVAECDARSTAEKLLESVAHLWSPML
jgi:cardiolipin synthase